MSIRLVLPMAVSLYFSMPALAEEDAIPWDRIERACGDYVDAFATPRQVEAMRAKLKEQIKTKVADSNRDEDAAAREIMLDWATDNRGRLVGREKSVMLQACFYFMVFRENNYLIPLYIREGLSAATAAHFCSFLEDEVTAKRKEDEEKESEKK